MTKRKLHFADPEAQRAFKRYFLNLWDQKENRAIDLAQWDSCQGDWKAQSLLPKAGEQVRTFEDDFLARFLGRRCWAVVDLSMTTDMSAVAFLFEDEDGFYDVLPFYWLPEAGLKKRELAMECRTERGRNKDFWNSAREMLLTTGK